MSTSTGFVQSSVGTYLPPSAPFTPILFLFIYFFFYFFYIFTQPNDGKTALRMTVNLVCMLSSYDSDRYDQSTYYHSPRRSAQPVFVM